MKAIVVKKAGSLEIVPADLPKLEENDVLVSQKYLGINYADIQQTRGEMQYPFPFVPGVEAVGVIEKIGDAVKDLKVGQRVGYCTVLYGAYSEKRIVDQRYIIPIPDFVSNEVAAAMLFKGMVAHYLLRRLYIVQRQSTILVHNADSDIGQIICQWADFLQAKVIGTVGSDERAKIALNNGCQYALNYNDEDCAASVMEITKNTGVNIVYDSIGLKTCRLSFESLAMFGIYAQYYNTSGNVPPIEQQILRSRSIFFTCPSIFHYKAHQFETSITAIEIFDLLKQNSIKPKVAKIYRFDEIHKAHQDLKQNNLNGQLIVKI